MDVHKETVVICVLSPEGKDAVHKTYKTYRNDLIRMRVWLKQLKVSEIAMESTGVYWRPLWNVLEEEGFRLLLYLMVLAIGAGSLMLSHINDAGFWLFKQYFNLSIKDTLRTWSVMETIVGVVGLLGVLVLDAIL